MTLSKSKSISDQYLLNSVNHKTWLSGQLESTRSKREITARWKNYRFDPFLNEILTYKTQYHISLEDFIVLHKYIHFIYVMSTDKSILTKKTFIRINPEMTLRITLRITFRIIPK